MYNTRSRAALATSAKLQEPEVSTGGHTDSHGVENMVIDLTSDVEIADLTNDDPPAPPFPSSADRHANNGAHRRASILDLIGPQEPLELILKHIVVLQNRYGNLHVLLSSSSSALYTFTA